MPEVDAAAPRVSPLSPDELSAVLELRHRLHARPEPAGSESVTVQILTEFLAGRFPDRIVSGVGGRGLAAVFTGEKPGPTVLFRAELDAVPVAEESGVSYASKTPGLSHACGHDGHMAILAGLAVRLARQRPACGKTVLLFQPAEETGEGAKRMLEDPSMAELWPDWCFALHNLPGFPLGTVLVRPGVFACASVGMRISLRGSSSHAAHPEEARSPAQLTARLIAELHRLPSAFDFFSLLTVTHARLGEPGFGVTPGEAEILLTLRAAGDKHLKLLKELLHQHVFTLAQETGLTVAMEPHEPFPALVNDPNAAHRIRFAAEGLGLNVIAPAEPFRWSEDFGHFTARIQGAFCGIGAGIDSPPLHSPGFDFPDKLIPIGIALFERIQILSIDPSPAAADRPSCSGGKR